MDRLTLDPGVRFGCGVLLLGWLCQTVSISVRIEAGEAGGAPKPVPAQGFHALGGPAPSALCAQAYEALLKGREADAFQAFQAAVAKNPQEAPAWFALGQQQRMRGYPQQALADFVKALRAGRSSPWAEIYLEAAARQLPRARDPQPFLDLAAAFEGKEAATVRPYLRALVRQQHAAWLLARGKFGEAAQVFAPLQYLGRWALIGPFDNRDKAGFDSAYEPEHEIDFSKPVPGRNRKLRWFHPNAEPLDGRVELSELFEPNVHVIAYGVTHVKMEQAQWAVMRVGCGGAVKVWLNEREVSKVGAYNDYAPGKIAVPVYLQKGWNQVLVKAAVVEDTEWVFSVRFSKPEGGPLPGLAVDASAVALKAYKSEAGGRPTPLLEPREPDLGVIQKLRAALKTHPQSAWLRAWLGDRIAAQKLGNKEDHEAAKAYARALASCPSCPLFQLMLALHPSDIHQARMAAEAFRKGHPNLPLGHELLARQAQAAGLDLIAEDHARQAIGVFGPERSGACPLILGLILQRRGEEAEAYRLVAPYSKRFPYDPAGWSTLADLMPAQGPRRRVIQKGIQLCGGDPLLRAYRAGALQQTARETEAAAFFKAGLAAEPFDISAYLRVARAWRAAGATDRARSILEQARKNAPENSALLSALGRAALYAGKPKEAVARWRSVLRVKPNSPHVKDWLSELVEGGGVERGFFTPYEIALKDLPQPRAKDYPEDNTVTMLNQEVVRVNANGTSSRMVHRVAKLLRPGGLRGLQSHAIYYDPQRQVVDILKAAVITPEGRELSRAEIFDRTVSSAMGVQTRIYDEYHLKQIRFRDLEPGSIVDLQYVLRDTGENIYGDYFSDTFYPGADTPTQRSEYILDLPKSREFRMRGFRRPMNPERVESKDPNREIFKWKLTNLPGIQREARMPPLRDQLPFVQATTMKTWQEVGTWYWNLAKDSIRLDNEMRKKVAAITAGAESATEKLRAVHDWVIGKIRYLGIEFGRNGYKPHRASETFKARYGDCKDTAVLITAMLKACGIKSRLVLVRAVNAGKVEKETLPAPNLFNHCIAYVPEVDGKDYWIDCTTDFHKLGEVPYLDQGAQVLVVGADGGRFVQIPRSAPEANRYEQRVNAHVKKDGSGTVFVRQLFRGAYAPYWRRRAATPGQFKRFVKERAARQFPGAQLLRLVHGRPEEQGPMWLEAEYRVPSLTARSGDRLALVSTLEKLNLSRKYLQAGAQRKHDLELWFPWARSYEINYHLDGAFQVVALPEQAERKASFGSFQRKVTHQGNIVTIRDEFVLLRHRISKEEYARFIPFCRKVDALLDQKILLKRK